MTNTYEGPPKDINVTGYSGVIQTYSTSTAVTNIGGQNLNVNCASGCSGSTGGATPILSTTTIFVAFSSGSVSNPFYIVPKDSVPVSVGVGTLTVVGLGQASLATSANQTTELSSLSSIDGKITACNTGAVSISAIPIVGKNYANRSDTFVGTGNGTTIDVSTKPTAAYAIAVKGTGASATTWDIRLEGSLDNSNFTQILQHTNTTGDGTILYSGTSLAPSLYIRSRVAGLVLGSATNVIVTILGTQ